LYFAASANTSLRSPDQFEYVLKNVFGELLETKRARWDEYQKESRERMVELAEYFSGEKVRVFGVWCLVFAFVFLIVVFVGFLAFVVAVILCFEHSVPIKYLSASVHIFSLSVCFVFAHIQSNLCFPLVSFSLTLSLSLSLCLSVSLSLSFSLSLSGAGSHQAR
jgi:hypothetical protein